MVVRGRMVDAWANHHHGAVVLSVKDHLGQVWTLLDQSMGADPESLQESAAELWEYIETPGWTLTAPAEEEE